MVSQLKQVKELLRNMDRRAKKALGQHFLVDSSYLDTMLAAAGICSDDTVIEVGPGLGVLTQELLKNAGRVIAVELDNQLAENMSKTPGLEVVNADILNTTPEQLLGDGVSSYKVVANLPYNIAAQVLRRFLESEFQPSKIVVMIQKEVAKNMMAEPPDMNLLAVGIQTYGKPKVVRKVPPDAFYPRPKVDSAIINIDVYDKPAVEVSDIEVYFKVARAGFGNKRKQLRNALANGLALTPKAVEDVLTEAGIDYQRRAQTLSLEQWAQISRIMEERIDNG
ncbi:MAG: ribosomal RNA small subunit methyltransferase A [Chloroflexi bacterium]|nr:ribosomal RNA small subunit methyltransferase A [Chloroflexota bacterium]MBT7081377.1 ribosomal RNA small subunit methyltransferase A [Chloroflexota bacterium]MBT7290338.1 ribosomal RNA small subunit methyltransferase A [Chloroflexota bacterium]